MTHNMKIVESSQSSVSTKDLKLNNFQQWILAFFVKEPNNVMTKEEIVDNMCLTALVDLDIDNIDGAIDELEKSGLIKHYDNSLEAGIIKISSGEKIRPMSGYQGTLTGRMYFKQKIIIPLVLAKRDDKVTEIIAYLNNYYGQNPLAIEIKNCLEIKDQKELVKQLATIAIQQFVPFMNILEKIQEKFFGNQ